MRDIFNAKTVALIRMERMLCDRVRSLIDELEYMPQDVILEWYDKFENGVINLRVTDRDYNELSELY